jgi:hypothetical protein
MAQAYYWDGTSWQPISGGGGGGGTGPQGPPGLNGESVTVYGPQANQPVGPRKGDIWFSTTTTKVTPDIGVVTIKPPEQPIGISIGTPGPTTVTSIGTDGGASIGGITPPSTGIDIININPQG